MALSPGTRLGRYHVAAEIGAGGMGEVYRATDPDLKRDVAIKVLPATLSADPERLNRFQREAEILASLNHPNIAIIYGLEKADSVRGIVMELVAGADLAQRIATGPSLALYANYSAAADGQRFLMVKRINQQEESPTQINVAINWFDELRRATAAK